MTLDVVLSGLGGQGILTLAAVLVKAAVREGYDARFLAQSGLAQLGSPVLAHVRIGLPANPSPKIPKGCASLGVALERLEALRLLPYLAPGSRALIAKAAVRPYEARFRPDRYPSVDDVEAAFAGMGVLWIPGDDLARRHGPPVLASAVMLGVIAGVTQVVDRDNLVICLREEIPHLADLEVEAFFEGYRFVTGRDD